MKPGDEVVCIDDSTFWYPPYPFTGDIDVIRRVGEIDGRVFIKLERFSYNMPMYGRGVPIDGLPPEPGSVAFSADCFRLLEKCHGEMIESIPEVLTIPERR